MANPLPLVPIPLAPMDEASLAELCRRADELGWRLESFAHGLGWELSPGLRHQEAVAAILRRADPVPASLGCECRIVPDVYLRLPDGTVKRPDVSVFCRRPEEDEGFIRMVPAAVVEVTSPGYEDKDLVQGPPIYRANGVADVIVLDRRSDEVHHWHGDAHDVYPSPHEFHLASGCRLTV